MVKFINEKSIRTLTQVQLDVSGKTLK